MEWQELVSLSSGCDPARHDSHEYYNVGGACQFDSLSQSQTPSYPSEVRISTYILYLDPRSLTIIQVFDRSPNTSSPLDSLNLYPSQMSPPNFLRNMPKTSPCIGLGHVENRHSTCLETSESFQTSEILPIERQDPKLPQAVNPLRLMKMKSLISTETGLSGQTSSSNGKNPRRCTVSDPEEEG